MNIDLYKLIFGGMLQNAPLKSHGFMKQYGSNEYI